MEASDIDPSFEPQTRARSNTWPLPENSTNKDDDKNCTVQEHAVQYGIEHVQPPKKNSSRRNAWGNMSYAELITQAIQSSAEKRLTLSQIYDWMVQNVSYFKDKGDSNSSAGWKNSIRHNLSLHNRFMRMQNEGTGKSSWWLINPDAKPGKAARRRATSMETQKYEKKRGRVKKKVEALRNGLDATPSPSSSVSEGLDMFPESPVHHSFQLSPDFRPRASSNASSCSRLSPIPSVESDMHDNQVPPPLSPLPWTSSECSKCSTPAVYGSVSNTIDGYGTEQLVDSMTENMKLANGPESSGYLPRDCGMKNSPTGQLSPSASHSLSGGMYNNIALHFGPRFRSNNSQEYSPYPPTTPDNSTLGPSPIQGQGSPQPLLDNGYNNLTNLTNITNLTNLPVKYEIPNSPSQNIDLTNAYNRPVPSLLQTQSPYCTLQQQQQRPRLDPQQNIRLATIRQRSLNSKELENITNQSSSSSTTSLSTSLSSTANQVMSHLMALNNTIPIPTDLDLSFDNFEEFGRFECDVDQVIRHELSVEGNLDFNFDPTNSSTSMPPTSLTTSTRQWVH